MLEIIYRIYQVADEETAKKNTEFNSEFSLYSSTSQSCNVELLMDCMVCDSRDHFKDVIRSMYGSDIPFRYSKKLQPGDVYCIIIGEHCWTTERYFNQISFKCDCCGAEVRTYYGRPICISDYEIRNHLYGESGFDDKRFCSNRCKEVFLSNVKKTLRPDDDAEFWISERSFNEKVAGYIYKITKKSTGEFYVGQTKYAPIFRWGQHLKTERFPIENIEDYQFEVIEIVPEGESILSREKFHIQSCYKADPEKSLNIACTHNLEV